MVRYRWQRAPGMGLAGDLWAEELVRAGSCYHAAVQFEARRRWWQDGSESGVNCSSIGNCIPFNILLHIFFFETFEDFPPSSSETETFFLNQGKCWYSAPAGKKSAGAQCLAVPTRAVP